MDDLKYWLWLNSIDDVGPVRAGKLIEIYKSPKIIWEQDFNCLRNIDGIGERLARIITDSKNEQQLEYEEARINSKSIKIVTINDESYPDLLQKIYAPPILLYTIGKFEKCDKNAIAIVGSRNATHYGIQAAYELARGLATRGITVVSGMAKGIDTAAHTGALDGGGRTIAVLGSGLDVIYPNENRELMKRIIKNGAIVSEYKMGTAPEAHNFPRRNRIISGLSLGSLIVEAGKKSGALITASFALEQNREVFAVPGQIFSKSSEGANNLIKQGAKLVCTPDDIIEELKIETVDNVKVALEEEVQYNDLSDDEKIVFNSISNIPIHLERLSSITGLSADKINGIITLLELKDAIRQLPGKEFVRNNT